MQLLQDSVYPGPTSCRHYRDLRLQRKNGGFRATQRARVHQHSTSRRDQEGPTEDTGCSLGGNAGKADYTGRKDTFAPKPLYRHCDSKSDRVRRSLSASRGTARPVPGETPARIPFTYGGSRDNATPYVSRSGGHSLRSRYGFEDDSRASEDC